MLEDINWVDDQKQKWRVINKEKYWSLDPFKILTFDHTFDRFSQIEQL